ncbi:hypothetical protein VTK73DRAFT_982 [Phialemonium thermophilum]|uniref:Alpha/beta hydrolase fold-3 domain-containing protein n=1 Tax=Phialemonium thermophilum TaxID=223376 RepID=A0ABR3XBU7_9PEZI
MQITHKRKIKGSRTGGYRDRLSVSDWPALVSQLILITCGLALKSAKATLDRHNRQLPLYDDIVYQGMREYQCGLKATWIQAVLPSTVTTCRRYAKKRGISYTEIALEDGTTIVWLGPSSPTKVFVLFHGGGYMAPALSQQVALTLGFAKDPPKDVAVVVLQYDLASEEANHYPRQLCQAVSLMNYLLYSRSIHPASMTLFGDSAGGHLLLSLILHINHPNPRVPPLTVPDRLSGAVLISPWVDLQSTCDSIKTNQSRDILSEAALAYWARNFLADADRDPWNHPLSAPIEWWKEIPVDAILLTYGDEECFRDDATKLAQVLQNSAANVRAVKCDGELHEHMIINRFLRINKPCYSETVLLEWLAARVDR